MAKASGGKGGAAPGLWGAAVAFTLHGALGVTMASVNPHAWSKRPPPTVELEVVEKLPPPPPMPEPPPPPPEPPPPKPVVRRMAAKPPPEPVAPPPPNQEPPPEPPADPAPPVFGVTLDSVVTGDSAVAVPVGNTLMTPDHTPKKVAPAPLPAAPAAPSFSPVAEMYIGEWPHEARRVTADYPPEARRLGIEGRVVLRVGIDRHGKVRSVRVVKKAGYGFDEAAAQALWKFEFTPARSRDGQAVDFVISYNYVFQEHR